MEIILDTRKRILVTSKDLAETLGIPKQTLIGLEFIMVISKIVPEGLTHDICKTLSLGKNYDATIRFKGEKGVWMNINASLLYHQGSFSGYRVHCELASEAEILQAKQVFKKLMLQTHVMDKGWLIPFEQKTEFDQENDWPFIG